MPETTRTSTPTVVRGWTDGRARRARMFSLLLAAAAVLALWSAFQPWYGFATSGPARCDTPSVKSTITVRTPQSNTAVEGVYANGCISGRGIAQQYQTPKGLSPQELQTLKMLDAKNTTKPPALLFGLPRTVSLLILSALVGVAGLASRNGWLGLAGIVGFFYSHKDLGALQTVMTTGNGGALNQPQQGLALFGWALVLGWGLLTAATLFVARHNADERQMAKRAAAAAGEPAALSPLDHVAIFIGGTVAKGVEAANRERERSEARKTD